MTVCKANLCPYWNKGFCSSNFTFIDENGMCVCIWRKGQIRRQPLDMGEQVKIVILDGGDVE